MLTQLVYILDRKLKADRMLNFVIMRSAFCRGVRVGASFDSPHFFLPLGSFNIVLSRAKTFVRPKKTPALQATLDGLLSETK